MTYPWTMHYPLPVLSVSWLPYEEVVILSRAEYEDFVRLLLP